MHCVENCIPKAYQLKAKKLEQAESIGKDLGYYGITGRPPVAVKVVMQAYFYLLRTGIQWCALPRCFGVSSTLHAGFQRLRDLGFFENIFLEGLDQYNEKVGIDIQRLVGDCSHAKSPLGKDSAGPSPVDRRKQGTKRSIITDHNGIILGCFVGPGNKNDAKLLEQTIQAIPSRFRSDYQECWLDAGYDTTEVRTICFHYKLKPRISPNPRRKVREPVRLLPKGVRWVVERSHSWINRFRRTFVRFDKLTDNYLASIKFAVATSLFKRLGVSG